jgi:3-hydroxybutyryl-CoA dehydrogenase
MSYEERLSNVAVMGAAGKMGSGILLLTAVEMADLKLSPENKNKIFIIHAIDVSQTALVGLMQYLRMQLRKIAEKKIVMLRDLYADRKDLISNSEIIDEYIFDVLCLVHTSTNMQDANSANLIFEAVSENPELKIKLISQIDQQNENEPWFFTNTSSVPINHLNETANLNGRILGFHFYNPPAVQKLVELIISNETKPELTEFAYSYAKKLRKKIVPSNDVAGFIGNGHFMRDALHAISVVEGLEKEMSFAEAVYTVNKISQELLVRPMGIFQLVDYVGIDVCQYIMKVMNPYLANENLHSDLLDQFMELGVKGGQNADGSQKDGFLKYEKGRPVAIFNPVSKEYDGIIDFKDSVNSKLGDFPSSIVSWKEIMGLGNREEVLQNYFHELEKSDTFAANLAKAYLKKSREIGIQLVSDNVANSEKDVNDVMLTGFYHSYGPINDFIKWREL